MICAKGGEVSHRPPCADIASENQRAMQSQLVRSLKCSIEAILVLVITPHEILATGRALKLGIKAWGY